MTADLVSTQVDTGRLLYAKLREARFSQWRGEGMIQSLFGRLSTARPPAILPKISGEIWHFEICGSITRGYVQRYGENPEKKLETTPKTIWKHDKERARPIYWLERVSKHPSRTNCKMLSGT